MSKRVAQPSDNPWPDHEEQDWWGTGKPEGQELGRVVGCEIDLTTQTLWVATTTHDVRVVAYGDLRPDEVPRLGSPVVQLGKGQVALLGQVGNWNVMELVSQETQLGALDASIPLTARLAAQRSLLVGLVAGGVILVKMGLAALSTGGQDPQEALLATVELGAALISIAAAAVLWKRIVPWFEAEPHELPRAVSHVGKSEQRRREQGRTAQPSRSNRRRWDVRTSGLVQRDWIAELDGGPGRMDA